MEAVGEWGGLRLDETKQLRDVENGYTYFRDGDVVTAKVTPCFENGKGAIAAGLIGGVAFGTTELHVLRAGARLDPRFLFYVTLSHPFRQVGTSEMYGAGGQKRVPEWFFRDFVAPLPPLPVQRRIAAFLDGKTAAIDLLIQKKEHLIELLWEKRQALITQAVTKGFGPSVPMKDSGVDYIGPIPRHWGTLRIALAAEKLCNGYVGPTRDILVGDGVPYLQSLHIKDGGVRFEKPYFVTPQWLAQHRRVQLRRDDVVVVQTGICTGQVGVIPDEWDGAGCHALIIFRPRSDVGLGRFFGWFLQSTPGRELLLRERTGALHPHLEVGKVREIPMPVPPVGEQREISAGLALIDGELRQQCEAVGKQIDLLREYRQALVSEAVTGQIKIDDERPSHG
jgi:type I restriction enzyme S subunit